LSTRVPLELRELLVSGAEGNPFYLEELVKMLIEQDVILTGEFDSLGSNAGMWLPINWHRWICRLPW
jgi:hypothetical protein